MKKKTNVSFLTVQQYPDLEVGSAGHQEAFFLPLPSEEDLTGAVLTVVAGCLTEGVPPDQDRVGETWVTWAAEEEACTGATWPEGEEPIGATSAR